MITSKTHKTNTNASASGIFMEKALPVIHFGNYTGQTSNEQTRSSLIIPPLITRSSGLVSIIKWFKKTGSRQPPVLSGPGG